MADPVIDTSIQNDTAFQTPSKRPSSGQEYLISDGQTETVVVYLDRAEVTRSFVIRVTQGENEIILKDLSRFIDQDSIRVEGRGPATISEVAFRIKYLTPDERSDVKEKESKIRKKLEDAKQVREVLQLRRVRLEKERCVLDGFADNAIKRPGITSTDGSTNPAFLSKDNLVGMTAFLELFDRQAGRLDDSLHNLKLEQTKNSDLIQSLEQKLGEFAPRTDSTESRELVILLEAAEISEVTLCLSYVVTNASWMPSYDVRVYSDEKLLKIQYYGVITQATDEDWLDTKICLSTATPSVGGDVPSLGMQKISFKQRAQSFRRKFYSTERKPKHAFEKRSSSFSVRSDDAEMRNQDFVLAHDYIPEVSDRKLEIAENRIEIVPHQVKESITTAMYEIARRSTIPSDNVGHKVTVAIVDLKPEFEYQTVPKMSAKAYLKAKVKNTSPYALLAGTSNIFLDNNFVAKSEMKAVSPNEEFTCSLGVDPTIRIEYKPLVKYREQSGLISKVTIMNYKQVIQVKNTHRDVINIQVVDQLPLSTEEKIKVTLLEPVIKHPEKYDRSKPIRLNSANNIEWDLEVAGGDTKELVLRYTVEHPTNREIESETVSNVNTSDA